MTESDGYREHEPSVPRGFRAFDLAARIDQSAIDRWRQAEATGVLPGLAERLHEIGLNQRAAIHVCGVRHALAAPGRVAIGGPSPLPRRGIPPAALMTHLFVLGSHLEARAVTARLGQDFETLKALDLIHTDGERVAATVTMVPIDRSMVVSDRADLDRGRSTALVADDSALHTIGAIPIPAQRPDLRWLDVGTGSAIVPLARLGSAATIQGTDINPRALAMARLGAALSRARHLSVAHADLLPGPRPAKPFHRITFNAPIPDGAHAESEASATADMPWYRYGTADILERFWQAVPEHIDQDGEVLVHSIVPEDGFPPWLAGLKGQVMVVRYTPPGMTPAFAMTAWQPGRETRYFIKQVLLTATSPHVTRAMLELE